MRRTAQVISWLALAGTIVPSIVYLVSNELLLVNMKSIMFVSTFVWFIATPLWMGRDSEDGPLEDEVVVP
jgi:hypothetical protein